MRGAIPPPPYVFMVGYLIKRGDIFTFSITRHREYKVPKFCVTVNQEPSQRCLVLFFFFPQICFCGHQTMNLVAKYLQQMSVAITFIPH